MTTTLNAGTALVTGASRGIGRGIALKLAMNSVKRIVLHYHKNIDAAEESAALVREYGAEPLLVRADADGTGDLAAALGNVTSRGPAFQATAA